jgi:hypothetical protein
MDAQIDPANSRTQVQPLALSRRERRRRAKLNGTLGAIGRERGPHPLDPLVDDRQVRAFDLRVSGLTLKQIAQQLGINRETAQLDISMEGRRRAEERGDERRALIEEAAARYERSLSRLELRAQQLQQVFADELRGVDGYGNPRPPNQSAIFRLTMGLAAIERAKAAVGKSHDLVLGLTSPARIKIEPTPETPADSTLDDILETMGPTKRTWLRQEASRLRRLREAADTGREPAPSDLVPIPIPD